jgi:signal peptidase I
MGRQNEQSVFRYPALAKFAIAIGGVVFGLILMRTFITPFRVADESMLPNHTPGETVYILKHVTPKTGDVVLFRSPVQKGRVLLKRVIAVEGDSVEISSRVVYRNNARESFKWKTISSDNRVFPMRFATRDNMAAVKIGRKSCFLLGDNLDASFDSRDFGPVALGDITGKVIYSSGSGKK